MRVSGVSFVRNAVSLDYPVIESITSVLPLCDEFIIAVGKSDDDTLDRIRAIGDPRIVIIETVWDDALRTGGAVLAQQTNVALARATGDWVFYIQADEVVHEADHPAIRSAMRAALPNPAIEGLLFDYVHFYGSYAFIGASRRWYRREVRVVRNGIGAQSWGDAQGFRIGDRKLAVKHIDARIFHYGWVKPPEIQQRKQQSFNKLWHSDEWVNAHVGDSAEYDYGNGGKLARFTGSHPAVMQARVAAADWRFEYDPTRVHQPMKEALLDRVESLTGQRIGEYRNYRVL